MPTTTLNATADALTRAVRDWMDEHPGQSPDRAYRRVLQDNPQLARDHHRGVGSPLDEPAPVTSANDPAVVLQQLAARDRITFREACKRYATLGQAYHHGEVIEEAPRPTSTVTASRRHYSTLSEAEQRHWLPMGSVRRLRPGDRPGPRETMFATFAPDDPGALFAEVTS